MAGGWRHDFAADGLGEESNIQGGQSRQLIRFLEAVGGLGVEME